MPKKAASTDGRKSRYRPMTVEEFDSAAKALKRLYGYFDAICKDMQAQGLTSLKVDGRVTLQAGLKGLLSVAKKGRGVLEGIEMDLE